MKISEKFTKLHNDCSVTFFLFGIWSFFLICRPQDYLSFLGYIRPNLSLGLIALLCYLYSPERNKIIFSKQIRLYYYLIIVMIISVPFSYYRRASLMDLINYGSVIFFVVLSYRIVNTASKLKCLIFAYCSGVSIYAVYILKYGSFADDRLSFGRMFDPNDIAFFILSFIFFNMYFVTNVNRVHVRIISAINILIGLTVILKTGSRGGLIALIAVFGYMLFVKHDAIGLSFVKKACLVVLAVVSLQFIGINIDRYKSIMDLHDDYNVTGEEGRIAIWKIGMKLTFTHPLTGIGFNRFPEAVGRDREARGLSSAKWHTAHNSLVQIGTETGIIGLALFIALSFNAFKIFGRIANESENEELAKIGMISRVGFIGHFVSAMFLSQAYSVYWAFYIVLSAVLVKIVKTTENTKEYYG